MKFRFPILNDILNRRAKKKPSDNNWLDIAKVAIPTILGSMAASTDLLTRLLSQVPRAALIIQAVLPVALLGACIYVVSSRVEEKETRIQRISRYFVYTFPEAARTTAKLALLPLAILAGYSFWGILPNGLAGRNYIAGCICNATDGQPVTDGFVEVLNAVGGLESVRPERLDDIGFFYSDLRWWGSRPVLLRVSGSTCKPEPISINEGVERFSGCQGETPSSVQLGKFFIWSVACKP